MGTVLDLEELTVSIEKEVYVQKKNGMTEYLNSRSSSIRNFNKTESSRRDAESWILKYE